MMLPRELVFKIFSCIDLETLLNNLQFNSLIYDAIPELMINNIENDNLPMFVKELGKKKEFKLLKRSIEELDKLEPEDNYLAFLDYDTLIELLQYNRSSREIIYRAIPSIVNLFYANKHFTYVTGIKPDKDLRYLMEKLMVCGGEFKLMKKLIEESIKIHPITKFDDKNDLYLVVVNNSEFLSNHNSTINEIQQYLELEPNYIWDCFNRRIDACTKHLNTVDKILYFIKILTAAISAKSVNVIKYFIRIWNNDVREDWISLYQNDILGRVIEFEMLLEKCKTVI